MDIALHLDPKSTISLQMQIYEQLAALIRKGGLKPGRCSSKLARPQHTVRRIAFTDAFY
jgi:hypothetical protein